MKAALAVKESDFSRFGFRPELKSPLRYPGGKSRAGAYLLSLVPNDADELCSPFLGGGSFEIQCAANEIAVHGYDVFGPLVEFWQCLASDAGRLADMSGDFLPLPRDDFYRLQKNQQTFSAKYERAAVYFALNRASYSGCTLTGGMSPGHPRFTPSAIERLRNFRAQFVAEEMDFEDSIARHPNAWLYCDPPYLIDSVLYGRNGDAHRGFDHKRLAAVLKKRGRWMLSYNDCEEVRELYAGYRILTPSWKYGMSNDKRSREAVILSEDWDAPNYAI